MVKVFTAFSDGALVFGQHRVRCALGKGGVLPAAEKREGDGASPAGIWPIRYGFYRPDRLDRPETALEIRPLLTDDGWCDDPSSPDYNKLVKLPFSPSHEVLWREDHVYDIVLVLGHNDDPPVPGMGSAIFMHLARDGYTGTEGCVAVALDDMLAFLAEAGPGDAVEILI